MNLLFNIINYVLAFFLMVIPLASCDGGGDSTGGMTGTLEIGLTDSPSDYLHVYVTIKEVQVNQATEEGDGSGWLTVLTPGETFDLLELQNGAIADLGLAELEAGDYKQMRLILDEKKPEAHPYANYLVIAGEDEKENLIELKVPSGFQTGIKIVHGFTIVASGATELILDFDAHKSIVQAGKSGQWLLKPTIKVLETKNYSVSGTVLEDGITAAVEGASISAQVYNSGTDLITGAAGTESKTDGTYFMYLPIPGDGYNIVATKDGYAPECQVLNFTQPTENADFTLIPATTGTLVGSVTGLAAEDSAFFSIRQVHSSCGVIEVASASVVNSASFEPLTLPAGTYQIVVSSDGKTSQEITVEVVDSVEAVLGINF
jgi:hypothetical protein